MGRGHETNSSISSYLLDMRKVCIILDCPNILQIICMRAKSLRENILQNEFEKEITPLQVLEPYAFTNACVRFLRKNINQSILSEATHHTIQKVAGTCKYIVHQLGSSSRLQRMMTSTQTNRHRLKTRKAALPLATWQPCCGHRSRGGTNRHFIHVGPLP